MGGSEPDREGPPAPHDLEGAALTEARYAGELGGTDLGRILALSDGIFAFAMTLLIIYVPPPQNLDLFAQKDIPALEAYVLGFLILGIWWAGHHRLFLHIRRWDRYLLWTNLLFLMTIAVQPFFLNLWEQFPNTTPAGLAYSGCEMATSLLYLAIWLQASHHRRLLSPGLAASVIRGTTERVAFSPLVFVGAVAVAYVAPRFTVDVFALLLPVQLLVGRAQLRRRDAARDGPGPSTE